MSRTMRKQVRSDGTELIVACDPWPPIHGFIRTRPISEDDEGIRENDYEPVIELLANCTAISGHCKQYIVVVSVRRNGQNSTRPAMVEGDTYGEILASLDGLQISHLAPNADPSQSTRLARHFRESKDRFLVEVLNPVFDLNLQDRG